jgi:mono/diheme cytochrome c family protein
MDFASVTITVIWKKRKPMNRMLPGVSLLAAYLLLGLMPAWSADAQQGKVIAERWCSGCHLVRPDQKTAPADQAPPFVTIAGMPDFGAGKLALLLLGPHPNMPKLLLSRSEVADLAEYIRTLPR